MEMEFNKDLKVKKATVNGKAKGLKTRNIKKENQKTQIGEQKFTKTTSFAIELKGLTCAHCAAKIEADASKMEGIKSAVINLLKQVMLVEADESIDKNETVKNVDKIVKKYENGIEVKLETDETKEDSKEEEEDLKKRVITLGIGIAIFVLASLLNIQELYKNILMIAAYLILGLNVLIQAVKNIAKGQVFDENFLMAISTIGAIYLKELPEAVFVMLFYQIGETFQDYAVGRSRRSIKELMNIRPDSANILTESGIKPVDPSKVNINDIIVVKPGEKIPLDGIVVEGSSQVDTSALTGESVPRRIEKNDNALSGAINLNGVLNIKVTKLFSESTVMKILNLVENASSKKSKTEQFITKFAKVYTPIVVFAAVALAVLPPIITGTYEFNSWLGRALIFLVISCPCALVLSVPLGFFSGVGEASKRGILVKGSNYIQALKETNTIVFDKTGTLTMGVFEVSSIKPAADVSEDELLKIAAFSEKMSNHPIAKSITKLFEQKNGVIDEKQISSYEEISGHGVKALINGKNIFAGNKKLMEREKVQFTEYDGIGSVVYISENTKFLGYIVVSDNIKEDSARAIKNLKNVGIKNIVMLTGDKKSEADKIAKELGIDTVFSELLPYEKVEKVENIYKENKDARVAFVGDGINDAPVLARADVGIAMGGIGSDAAIEAADVVIMNDETSKIADGIVIAKNTNKIVIQNIVFALGVKAVVLVLGALGLASMWLAVFADVGVAFLAILNSMRKKI